jgi:hypothetical protein
MATLHVRPRKASDVDRVRLAAATRSSNAPNMMIRIQAKYAFMA